MPDNDNLIESRIQVALHHIEGLNKPNIKACARTYNVPYQRLLARYKGRPSLSERRPNGRKLDEAQESALCRYIDYLDSIYIPPSRQDIAATANEILTAGHVDPSSPAPTIGGHWLNRFMKRHPEYHIRRQRAMDIERKKCLDKDTAREFFAKYQEVITSHGIPPEDIWNFDETGFNIGVGRDRWIITREPKRQISSGINSNREYATVIEAISATGIAIAPTVILSAKLLMHRWFDIVGDKGIAVTETSYLNNALAIQWIMEFYKATSKITRGTYRLLVYDGFGSHITWNFVNFCEKHKSIVCILPPHSSHILQPLDVSVFSAYKHWHSKWVYDATVSGYSKITKDDFLGALAQIRQQTFKPSTVKLGFRLTGLWPINPTLVIDELVDLNTPSPPSSALGSGSTRDSDLSTPKTIARVKKLEERLEDKIARIESPSSTRRLINKLAKAATEFSYLTSELQSNLERTEYLREIRYARERQKARKSAKLYGIVHSSQLKRI